MPSSSCASPCSSWPSPCSCIATSKCGRFSRSPISPAPIPGTCLLPVLSYLLVASSLWFWSGVFCDVHADELKSLRWAWLIPSLIPSAFLAIVAFNVCQAALGASTGASLLIAGSLLGRCHRAVGHRRQSVPEHRGSCVSKGFVCWRQTLRLRGGSTSGAGRLARIAGAEVQSPPRHCRRSCLSPAGAFRRCHHPARVAEPLVQRPEADGRPPGRQAGGGAAPCACRQG